MKADPEPVSPPVLHSATHILKCAVAATLLAALMPRAEAQNLPNQSNRRMEFGSGAGQQELPSGAYFEPRVGWALQYADNVTLAPDGGESSFGVELSPGMYASYRSERFVGAADYSLIGRLWELSDLDDVTQQLAANGRWVAVPELLSISGNASYGDTVIDYANGGNYGNIGAFNTGNLIEQATAALTPELRKRFKDFEFIASYTYGRVWYLDSGKQDPGPYVGFYGANDSVDQRADVSLGLLPDGHKLFGRVFYNWEDSDYEYSLSYRFERAGFDGGFELSRTLSFVGDVGKESDLAVSTTQGGLDSDFWSAGLRWAPSARTSVEARTGDRFFGQSYSAEIQHSAKIMQFSASYDESPQVQTRDVSLGDYEPGDLPPWFDPSQNFSRFAAAPYLGKNANIQISARGLRTNVTLSGFYSLKEYLDSPVVQIGDEEGTGVHLLGSRELASNLSIDGEISYTDYQRDASALTVIGPLPASHDYDTEFTVRGNRDFGPHLIASIEAGYFNRSGTTEYDGWWVGLRGTWFPDFGR